MEKPNRRLKSGNKVIYNVGIFNLGTNAILLKTKTKKNNETVRFYIHPICIIIIYEMNGKERKTYIKYGDYSEQHSKINKNSK